MSSLGPTDAAGQGMAAVMRLLEEHGVHLPTTGPGHRRPATSGRRGGISDLSVDEILLLHSIGWEATDLVCGASVGSIPQGVWQWGTGEVTWASQAHVRSVSTAADRLEAECRNVRGVGVVGVEVDIAVHPHHVDVVLTGTAVRPVSGRYSGPTFASDLSVKDFTLLHSAGWDPVGLAFGASFVHAPRRGIGAAISQKGQNVELTNYTEALYSSREAAMGRMQDSALALGATGVVDVTVNEGPMPFAHHAIGFTTWGTAVKLGDGGHNYLTPRVVMPVDDPVTLFNAQSLRG